MKPHNNIREGLKTSQSNTDNTIINIKSNTKNKFLKVWYHKTHSPNG